MNAPIVVRLVGAAVAAGLSPDPAVFGEALVKDCIARVRMAFDIQLPCITVKRRKSAEGGTSP
jgi:hypothetical protein